METHHLLNYRKTIKLKEELSNQKPEKSEPKLQGAVGANGPEP